MKMPNGSAINTVIGFLGAALVVFFAGVCVDVAFKQAPPTQLWAAGGAIAGALVGVLMPAPSEGAASAASSKAADATHDVAVRAALTASQVPEQQDESDAAAQAVAAVREVRPEIHSTNASITRGKRPSAAAAAGADTARLAVQALADDAEAAVQSAEQAVDALNHPEQGQRVNPQLAAGAVRALAKAQTKRRVLQSAAQGAAGATDDATTQGLNAAKSVASSATRTVWILAGMFVVFLGLGIALETANATTQEPLVEAGKTVIALASSAGAALVALFAPQPNSKPGG
jgi:preprotein translocase subunit SecG